MHALCLIVHVCTNNLWSVRKYVAFFEDFTRNQVVSWVSVMGCHSLKRYSVKSWDRNRQSWVPWHKDWSCRNIKNYVKEFFFVWCLKVKWKSCMAFIHYVQDFFRNKNRLVRNDSFLCSWTTCFIGKVVYIRSLAQENSGTMIST